VRGGMRGTEDGVIMNAAVKAMDGYIGQKPDVWVAGRPDAQSLVLF
jgi:hypothetical protein